jgi:hypothetical protein
MEIDTLPRMICRMTDVTSRPEVVGLKQFGQRVSNHVVDILYVYGYQNALGGRLGHLGEGKGGANLFDSSS